MTAALRAIGVDVGPIPGVVVLDLEDGPSGRWLRETFVYQCTANAAPDLLDALLLDADQALVQVEKYVVGKKSGRVTHAGANALTRDLVGQLERVVAVNNGREISVRLVQRSAGEVKPWATEIRLATAKLLEPTKGMRHARDAAKHALFVAVHDAELPDPLSRRWSA